VKNQKSVRTPNAKPLAAVLELTALAASVSDP
jgi:hypothetical protein